MYRKRHYTCIKCDRNRYINLYIEFKQYDKQSLCQAQVLPLQLWVLPVGTSTITYTVTDGNGYSTTSTGKTITVTKPVANAITGTPSVYIGSGNTLTSHASGTGTLTYTWASSNPAVATVSGTATTTVVNRVSAGTTNITYTVTDGNGCSTTSAPFTVTVNPKPVAGNITGANTVCQSSIITLTANPTGNAPFTYTWNSTVSGVATVTNAGVVTAGTTNGSTVITYTVTDVNGCSATSAGFTVTVTKPVANAITGNATVCIGSGITLASSATGTGTLTYTWNSSNPAAVTVSGTGSTTTAVGVAIGTSTITYTVTDGNGCSTTSTGKTITVTKPVANAITGTPSVCIGSGNTLTSHASGTGTLTYTWASSNPAVATVSGTATTTVVNGVSAGTTNITYTVTDGNGCSTTSAPFTVTVNPKPVAGAITAPSTQVCIGSSMTLTSHASGTATLTYTWNSSNPAVATVSGTAATTTLTSVGIGTTNITYTVTDGNGCANTSATFQITVNDLPDAPTVTPASATVCLGNIQSLFSGILSAPNDASASFSGSQNIPDNTASGRVNTLNIAGVPAGATINYINIQFNISETNDGDLIINLKSPAGQVLNLVNKKGGSGNNFTNTIVSSTGTTTFASSSPSYTGTFAADAAIPAVGATGGGGNTANVTSFSTFYSTPYSPASLNGTWQFSVRDVSGFFQDGTLNNWSITINYTTPLTPIPVTWSPIADLYSDAAATTPYISNQSLSTVYLKPFTTVSRTYTATATNAAGCTSSTDIPILVNAIPTGTLTASQTTFCAGTSITFTATTGYGAYTFKVNSTIVQSSTSNIYSTNTLVNGDQVTVDVANSSNCGTTFNPVTVIVNPLPAAGLIANKNPICQGDNVTFTASGGTSYNFKVNNISSAKWFITYLSNHFTK